MNSSIQDLETPRLLIDNAALLQNIREAQQTANRYGVALRPHVKTHKCLEIARLQIDEGAAGVTASKVGEALVFIENGFGSVTVAYPLISDVKLDRLLKSASDFRTDLRLIVDSLEGVAAVAAAARRNAIAVSVFLKVDVGLHRCGVREDDPRIVDLVRRIKSEGIAFAGLLSHAGHIYRATNREEASAVARGELAILGRVKKKLEDEGIEVAEVSVGSTPGLLSSDSYDGITENRPGNYVFLDLNIVRMNLVSPRRVALSVLTTIVSLNRDFYIVDAGSKVLTSDVGAHGQSGVSGYGIAFPLEGYPESDGMIIERLSEEHGFVKRSSNLRLGSKLRIIPNHACPVANLGSHFVVLEDERAIEEWPVAARACVL
jgi:D-serine deaminase-like pyridoxal phosphate-dependent protein